MRQTFSTIGVAVLLCTSVYAESLSDLNLQRLREPRKSDWGRDPFIRYGQKDEKKTEDVRPVSVKISGIIADDRKAVAIINGNFYRVGDRVDEFRVLAISNERVLLEHKGKKYYFGIEKFALEGGKK
jgi:type II secretory pathway component PulC